MLSIKRARARAHTYKVFIVGHKLEGFFPARSHRCRRGALVRCFMLTATTDIKIVVLFVYGGAGRYRYHRGPTHNSPGIIHRYDTHALRFTSTNPVRGVLSTLLHDMPVPVVPGFV